MAGEREREGEREGERSFLLPSSFNELKHILIPLLSSIVPSPVSVGFIQV